jgi:phage protein D
MFKYVLAIFPETTAGPKGVYSAVLHQKRYHHEIIQLTFLDWGVDYDDVTAGSPIKVIIESEKERREFYGYVHHVKGHKTPGTNFVEVVAISSSFSFKTQTQKVWKNITADAIIKQIAAKHNFVAYTVPHPRVYPQVAQAGHSDWSFMVRLAKQCGYSLRTENTELYFQPMLEEYTKYRQEAPVFSMAPEWIGGTSIYSFVPLVGEDMHLDGDIKGATAVAGVDASSKKPVKVTEQTRNRATRERVQTEFFDRIDTDTVVPDIQTAAHEAKSVEDRNTFPYRATVEVMGHPNLRPDKTIYLDGLGVDYSGFWTILGTEHIIVREDSNSEVYTCKLLVGTDSLGKADAWVDAKTILSPDYSPKRSILPNVKQTTVKPTTSFKKTTNNISPQQKASFGTLENRAKPASKVTIKSPGWITGNATLNVATPEVHTTAAAINRLKAKGLF